MFTLVPWKKDRTDRRLANVYPLELFRRFDEIFNRVFDGYGYPAVVDRYANNAGFDVREADKDFIVSFDAPGFEASEFDIEASDDGVTVSAEHVVKEGEQTRSERSLKRHFSLPGTADPNKIEAKYRNGVLELRIAKAEQAKLKKIEVKSE